MDENDIPEDDDQPHALDAPDPEPESPTGVEGVLKNAGIFDEDSR